MPRRVNHETGEDFIENVAGSSHEFFEFTIPLRLYVTLAGNKDGCPG
jgi:hypothetical protein